jgi:endoglucanase
MKSLGFNTLRIPFAMEGVMSGNYRHNGAYDVLHTLFVECEQQNMSVILDLHRLFFHTTSPLWHSSLSIFRKETNTSVVLSETNVLTGWKVLLSLFQGYHSLLGIDLYNEPHGIASFHSGNTSTDFQRYVEKAVQELDEWSPLFFITGIQWGQDMRNYSFLQHNPRLIMAPHVYGPALTAIPGGDEWMTDPHILEYRWKTYFGYLGAPPQNRTIVIGEFGASQYFPHDLLWLSYFVDYLKTHPSWGWIYWAWNPGSHDVEGFLEWDWKTPVPSKYDILSRLL